MPSVVMKSMKSVNMSKKTDDYINRWKLTAIMQGVFYGIPPSITLAQSILESGWGESQLSTAANNYFGIKAGSGWTGQSYNADTHEYYSGVLTNTNASFRAYKNPLGSFKDHSKFLKENQRYSDLFSLNEMNYKGWAVGLKSAGYATSPTYDTKLIALIEQYDLNRFDKWALIIKLGGGLALAAGLILLIMKIF